MPASYNYIVDDRKFFSGTSVFVEAKRLGFTGTKATILRRLDRGDRTFRELLALTPKDFADNRNKPE